MLFLEEFIINCLCILLSNVKVFKTWKALYLGPILSVWSFKSSWDSVGVDTGVLTVVRCPTDAILVRFDCMVLNDRTVFVWVTDVAIYVEVYLVITTATAITEVNFI